MAQKAQKTTASKNATSLNRLHLISLVIHGLFLFVSSFITARSRLAWILISMPSFVIEYWFERIARPAYEGVGNDRILKKAGEDLDAKGLTEWMWDLLYWTWACVALATIVGNKAWYLFILAPIYSIWLAWSTVAGARQGLGNMMGVKETAEGAKGQSNRQAKLEKRGGQKVQYR